ncbi:cellulase family glycosylhydrolase [Streptomyces sp. TLI_171]|uniref:cellulase family glycosylhydrolase n=1 Tax=Streptomyces sp. TLI_171 TaxID=1938859 RepID=UPI000C18FD26|nr:cellulase family glycosylhydrolase [Streptomyces sp. TLI_171]RKE23058.1 cellulose binding domain-containing protein [Streptomyces sp. TLI_171]
MRLVFPDFRSRRHRAVTGAVAAGLTAVAAASLVALPEAAEAAGVQCKATYAVQNDWGSGFQASVTITNLGAAWTSWTLGYTYAGNQALSSGWNGDWTQSGKNVTVSSLSWNGSVPAGGTVTPAATFSYSGANAAPTDFTVNGVHCGGTPTTPPPTEPPTSPPPTTPPPAQPAPALHVSGNRLVTAAGAAYRLLGVNRSSGEFACVQGKGMWDGPADQATVDAMKAWNVHAVRIPLNEECWLGTSEVPAGGTTGAAYQQAVKAYTDLLVANGINVVLELHWTHGLYTGAGAGCSDVVATCQKPMPDLQYSPTFWTQVATAYKGDDAVLFDLFNEPYPDAADNWTDAAAAWTCLRDGGTCTGIGYPVAGMQTLVDAVRATGATNVIMTGGLTWTNDLSQWLAYAPADPTGNLMASWHSYNFNGCVTTACWDSTIGSLAAKVPVQAGEIGQNTCAHDYLDRVMAWADANGVGYTAWTWNPWGVCGSNGNVLIADWSGTPTATFGEGYRAHLLTQHP